MNTGKLAIGAALTVAVVVASSSTTVLAMNVLPKNSVGHQQLKTGAVTTKKIDKHSITGSKVKAGTFVSSAQMKFGRGNATDVPATTIFKLPRVHAVVTTDGDADGDPIVVVRVPKTPGVTRWIVQINDEHVFGAQGGKMKLTPPDGQYDVSATVWRYDTSTKFYLHCSFDTTLFADAPMVCYALTM
jgi:hypothetical protein